MPYSHNLPAPYSTRLVKRDKDAFFVAVAEMPDAEQLGIMLAVILLANAIVERQGRYKNTHAAIEDAKFFVSRMIWGKKAVS